MLKNLFVWLLASLIFLTTASNARSAKPNLYFDLVNFSYAIFTSKRPDEETLTISDALTIPYGVGHYGKFMIFFGSLGVGTAIVEHSEFYQNESGSVSRADTHFWWIINGESFISLFPIILDYMPYSKQLALGNLSIHGYLKYSTWTSGQYQDSEYIGEHYDEFTSSGRLCCLYRVYKHPSSYFDIGVSVSFNPLKFVPLWLRLGIQRLDYAYHIPESFKKAKVPVPSPVETRFYVSYGLSIGYWGIK